MDAVELEKKKKKGQKRTQIQYIKMSHNRLMIAVKIREKSNISGTSFFNNVKALSAGKVPIHVLLASSFPLFILLEQML